MPNKSRPPPIRNQLLAALPGKEYQRLLPHLGPVPLPFMEVLYEGGEPIRHVYFPDMDDVTVIDRNRLEATACECYGVVKAEYARNAYTWRP